MILYFYHHIFLPILSRTLMARGIILRPDHVVLRNSALESQTFHPIFSDIDLAILLPKANYENNKLRLLGILKLVKFVFQRVGEVEIYQIDDWKKLCLLKSELGIELYLKIRHMRKIVWLRRWYIQGASPLKGFFYNRAVKNSLTKIGAPASLSNQILGSENEFQKAYTDAFQFFALSLPEFSKTEYINLKHSYHNFFGMHFGSEPSTESFVEVSPQIFSKLFCLFPHDPMKVPLPNDKGAANFLKIISQIEYLEFKAAFESCDEKPTFYKNHLAALLLTLRILEQQPAQHTSNPEI